jgi:hypothetical protein
MKIQERHKPIFTALRPFNDAVFVNSTTGLVPPARHEQIEEVFLLRHHSDDCRLPCAENEFSNKRRTILRSADFSSRSAAGTKFRNPFSISSFRISETLARELSWDR